MIQPVLWSTFVKILLFTVVWGNSRMFRLLFNSKIRAAWDGLPCLESDRRQDQCSDSSHQFRSAISGLWRGEMAGRRGLERPIQSQATLFCLALLGYWPPERPHSSRLMSKMSRVLLGKKYPCRLPTIYLYLPSAPISHSFDVPKDIFWIILPTRDSGSKSLS